MLVDRPTFVVFCSAGIASLDALAETVHQSRMHVLGLDLLCAPPEVDAHREALSQLRAGWRWVPPLRGPDSQVVPGSAVLGVHRSDADVHDRLLELTGLRGVRVVGVLGEEERLGGGLRMAMTLLARTEDAIRDLDGRPVPFVRVGRLCGDPTVWRRPFDELARCGGRPPTVALRGRLRRHAGAWTYRVAQGEEVLRECSLSSRLGAALAASVDAPGAPAHAIYEAATAPPYGWSVGGTDDVERMQTCVNQWFSRLRTRLRPWVSAGLGDFVPARGTRSLVGRVDIDFDPDLPWGPSGQDARCRPRPTSSPISTTAPIYKRG